MGERAPPMTLKSDIDVYSQEIKEMEDKCQEIQIEISDLRERREKLIIKMIIQDKLFEDTSWEIVTYIGGIRLDLIKSYNSSVFDVFEPIHSIFFKDMDVWIDMADGISLRFEAGDTSLVFKEPKQVMPFIKKHKIKLNGGTIVDRLAKMKRDTAALESIVHTFNLWNKKT